MADRGDGTRVGQLQRELEAAQEIIEVLKRSAERHQRHHGLDQFAIQKAMANLEGTISQRTRELRRSEERYRALFDHSPIMALTVNEEGVITDANHSAASLQDQGRTLTGRRLSALFDDEARDGIEQLLEQGSGTAHELSLEDGRVVDATIAKVPGHADGQVLLRDITDWLELQREVQHTRRLASIGKLAAGVAHEINNPLAVLQLAMRRLEQEGCEDRDPAINELLSHANRIGRIVENLQSFASPHPPEPRIVAVADLIEAARKVAAPSMKSLRLQVEVCPTRLHCFVDRGQLEQVFVNLLTNSARATDGQGLVRIDAHEASGCVRVQLSDDGPGIPAQLLEDIFTPFVGGETPARAGMGLGLSITWGLVRENGGTIIAYNAPQGGACFELTLPAAVADRPSDSAARRAPSRRPSSQPPHPEGSTASSHHRPIRRVLCVDDEPSLREMMVMLLQADGFDAEGVSSAEQALERLAQSEFDVVISDLRLPKMSGRELAQKIAEHHPPLKNRVVLMSGLFSDRKSDGPYLQKPFTEEQLLAVLEQLGGPGPSGDGSTPR